MRLLLAYLFLLLMSFSGIAQEKTKGFKGGLMLGLVGSQIDGDQNIGYNKAGISMGVYSCFVTNNRWQYQLEIQLIMY